MAAFFVGIEGVAQAVEKMAIFDFAAFGFVRVGPKNGVGFGVEEGDARVSFRNIAVVGGVEGSFGRKLTVGESANVISIVEAKDEIGFIGAVSKVEAAPLVDLEDEAIFQFVETGFVEDENGVGANHGVGKILRSGGGLHSEKEETAVEQESHRDGERIPVHKVLQRIGNGGFTVVT
jgi:hypothetical protein